MRILELTSPNDCLRYLQRPRKDKNSLRSDVMKIMEAVRTTGDRALFELTEKLDGVKLSSVIADERMLRKSADKVTQKLVLALELALENIETFHRAQLPKDEMLETKPGVSCFRRSVALEKVGLYVPGGSAPLFSTLLMLGTPARIAGCEHIAVASPPLPDGTVHPAIAWVARALDVDRVYLLGGAQAIAALAYGTESVESVHKIYGPGNQYVTAAKELVQEDGVAIDMPAGPSEVLVVVDDSADDDFVAADLLAQAEHGPDSQVVLVGCSLSKIESIVACCYKQLPALPRAKIAEQALGHSIALVVQNLEQALLVSNLYAPEHLILALERPRELVPLVKHAGSVFLGHFSPEAAGDYASGTNHSLPTFGWARSTAGVSLDSFLKKITFQEISPQGLSVIGPAIEVLAEAEGLEGHRRSISLRLENLKDSQ